MNQLAKTFSLTACALAVSALINACGGGGDGGAVVPPTVAITATGDANAVTFTFKFSADVGESFAASDDVTLIGGTISAKVIKDNVDPTLYTLVVTPNPGATTVDVTVAANSFFDLATNIPNDASAKGEYCISSCETATTSTTSTSTTSTTVAPSTTSVMTFDDPNAKIAAFNGGPTAPVNTSSIIVETGTHHVLQFVRSAQAETWAGVTISTLANFAIPTVPLTETKKNVTLKVKAPASGVIVRLKLEDASVPAHFIEAEATTTVANEWETLTFNFANPPSDSKGVFSASNVYNKATVFPYFGKTGAEAGGEKTVYIDELAFVQADSSTTSTSSTSSTTSSTTTTTLASGTLATFSETTAPPTVDSFGGDVYTIEPELTGSTNKVLKIVQTATTGNLPGTNVALSKAIPLTMASRTITLRVKAAAAGTYQVKLRLANKNSDGTTGADTKAVETTVSAPLTTDWKDVTFTFDRYLDSPGYDKLTVFFNLGGTGANTFYVDDIKLASTTPALASFDEGDKDIYKLSPFGTGLTSTWQVADPLNAANKVAKVDLASGAIDWAGTVFYNMVNDTTVANLLTANSQTVKLYVYSPKADVTVRLTLEDPSTKYTTPPNPSAIIADAKTTKINTWENMSFDFSKSVGYSLAIKYNKATVSFNYGNVAPAIFYFENLTPAP